MLSLNDHNYNYDDVFLCELWKNCESLQGFLFDKAFNRRLFALEIGDDIEGAKSRRRKFLLHFMSVKELFIRRRGYFQRNIDCKQETISEKQFNLSFIKFSFHSFSKGNLIRQPIAKCFFPPSPRRPLFMATNFDSSSQ